MKRSRAPAKRRSSLGDYALARTYLRQLPPEANDVRNTRDLVELVLSNDPLAKRIGSAERRRRLAADFSYASSASARASGSAPTAS